MPMASLVYAWQLGYDFGRREARAECRCPADEPPDNVLYLDDYRNGDECQDGTN